MKRLIVALLFLPALVACDDTLVDILECRQPDPMRKAFDCSDPNAPARLPYQFEDGRTEVLDSKVQAVCKEGICESLDTETFRGTGGHAGTIQQRDRLSVTHNRDYYIGNASDGRIVAYRLGTGPQYGGSVVNARKLKGVDVTASRIPDEVLNAKPNEKFIYSDENPAYIDGKTWNVQCEHSTCFLGNVNNQISPRNLIKVVPFDIPKFRDEGGCHGFFCTSEDEYGGSHPIGLNPETFLANGIEGIYARGYQPPATKVTAIPTSIDPEFIQSERNPAMERNGKFWVVCDYYNETCRLGSDHDNHLIINSIDLPKFLPPVHGGNLYSDGEYKCSSFLCGTRRLFEPHPVGYDAFVFDPPVTESMMKACMDFQIKGSQRTGNSSLSEDSFERMKKSCRWKEVEGFEGFSRAAFAKEEPIEESTYNPNSGSLASMPGTPAIVAQTLPSTQASDNSCVDAWVAEHRKEVGEEAMIHWAMLEEWEEWCEAGKTP